MTERFALYVSPPAKSLLYQKASTWLQYDAYTGKSTESFNSVNFSLDQPAYEIHIKNAAKYGFHATLKPPFRLKEGQSQEQLIQAIYDFCIEKKPIDCGKLQLTTLGNFITLGLEKPCQQLNTLAQQCVETFEPFRAELNSQEFQKRNPEKLTRRQQVLLNQWGYPYVDDEYRFHLTLTDSLPTEQLEVVKNHLHELFLPVLDRNIQVNAVHLFHQENEQSHFKVIRSFPFSGLDFDIF